jgi:hypothetical protein
VLAHLPDRHGSGDIAARETPVIVQ